MQSKHACERSEKTDNSVTLATQGQCGTKDAKLSVSDTVTKEYKNLPLLGLNITVFTFKMQKNPVTLKFF